MIRAAVHLKTLRGERLTTLRRACEQLRARGIRISDASAVYEDAAADSGPPRMLGVCIVVEYEGTPSGLAGTTREALSELGTVWEQGIPVVEERFLSWEQAPNSDLPEESRSNPFYTLPLREVNPPWLQRPQGDHPDTEENAAGPLIPIRIAELL